MALLFAVRISKPSPLDLNRNYCNYSKKLSSNLQKVRHDKHESFQSYIDRFNVEGIQVDNLNIKTAFEVIKKDCRNSKIVESLIKKLV